MLAVAVTDALALIDAATAKKAPPFAPITLTDIEPCLSSTWATDNSALYLLSARNIRRYTPSNSSLEDVFTAESGSADLSHIVAKDRNTLIFSAADKVHVLDCTDNPKISQTFASHKSAVTSLSLSNDLSLLASTSSNATHVHNLVHGSHTVLRGLPLAQTIAAAAFSKHARTKLLIAMGRQLVVFDTTRPSGPSKAIALDSTSTGNIVSIACSPFSKTLVAVATSTGFIGLIDLEKEKGLFRTLNLKVPSTCIAFSPEGASIYTATETGILLLLDLRGLDKVPKSIMISESGNRVETMSVQPRNKTSTEASTRTISVRAPSAADVAKPKTPTRTARVASSSRHGQEPPLPRKPSAVSTPKSRTSPGMTKKVFSPVRDPLGNSVSMSDISLKLDGLNPARPTLKTSPIRRTSLSSSLKRSPTRPSSHENLAAPDAPEPKKSPLSKPALSRTRTTSTTRRISVTKATPVTSPPAKPIDRLSAPPRTRTLSAAAPASPRAVDLSKRTRTISANSRASKTESISTRSTLSTATGSRRTSTLSSASRVSSERQPKSSTTSSSMRDISPIPPTITLPCIHDSIMTERFPTMGRNSTPSPDLPDIDRLPETPMAQKKKGMAVLGLKTPDVERWIHAGGKQEPGKKKSRSVGFAGDDEDADAELVRPPIHELKKVISMEIQVSPQRRPTPISNLWAPSPLRNPSTSPGGPNKGSAQDFLKGIVGDVMFEHQRETKAQMVSLHLEMMSMRRGWRKELSEVMEQYVGDLKDLREENRRLREENERLRRGY